MTQPLREQLGEALIAAAAVPHTMPIEVFGQAGVLADAVLPVALRLAASAARDAVDQAAAMFEARGRAFLDGGIMTAADAAVLLREHASRLTEQLPDASAGYPPVFPWFELMDDEDQGEFLLELAWAAITKASTSAAYRDVERAIATWRGIAVAQHAHTTAPGPGAQAVKNAAIREEKDTRGDDQSPGAASTARSEAGEA